MPADIVNTKSVANYNRLLVAGERLSIRILNADGTVKEELCDASVPTGKKVDQMAVSYSGSVENA